MVSKLSDRLEIDKVGHSYEQGYDDGFADGQADMDDRVDQCVQAFQRVIDKKALEYGCVHSGKPVFIENPGLARPVLFRREMGWLFA